MKKLIVLALVALMGCSVLKQVCDVLPVVPVLSPLNPLCQPTPAP